MGSGQSLQRLQQRMQQVTTDIRLAEQQQQNTRTKKKISELRGEQIELQKQIMNHSRIKIDGLYQQKFADSKSPRGQGQRDATQPRIGYAGQTQYSKHFLGS